MSLSEYEKMRNFSNTPEPAPRRFVIQKHKARRLHYDLRLESRGVLKSWAVPKGPSLDPEIKRLAIETEDHPLEYRMFEGTIPEGNYGAGEVIVWDNGTYELKGSGKSFEQAYKKGHLTFILHGIKLQGTFTLIRQSDEEKSWFLYKNDDEFSSKHDIAENVKSVLTSKTLQNGNTKNSEPSGAEGAKKAPMPDTISPMLATLWEASFDSDDFIYELKWDGYRCIARVEDGKVTLRSRNQKDLTQKYKTVTEALKAVKDDCIMDGEIVVLDENGIPHFEYLQQSENNPKARFVVFDLLYLKGYSLQNVPLLKRKELLRRVLPPSDSLIFCEHIEKSGRKFFELAKSKGIEGIVAKKKDSLYKSGYRSKEWRKIKAVNRQEAIICGYTLPKGTRGSFGALILGVFEKGELKYIGHTGTGFSQKNLSKIKNMLDKNIRKDSPFDSPPKTNAPVIWTDPKIVCEVTFTEWTREGLMRHPSFIGLREDKTAGDVEFEKIEKEQASKVVISNPSKIFFKDAKITKGEIASYYRDVSGFILPYLKNRPLTLIRYPNGIEGEHFYQKDYENAPDFIGKKTIYSETDDKFTNYLVCQNLESLLYIVNLGCIDMHPWNSRISKLENPDYVILDLDPLDVPYSYVIRTALVAKKVLESAGIQSYPKTSGATGFHIYIPLGAKYSYEIARKFSELLARIIHEQVRDITSVERSPARRKRKVYVDFLQNRHAQTVASVYSLRPRSGATVSTPLRWDEVRKNLTPESFTFFTIRERINKMGDVWEGMLTASVSIEKSIERLQKSRLHISK